MPDFHIDGDSGAVRSRTAQMRSKGQSFVDTGDALAKISTDGWTGRAAEKFADKFEAEPERWRKAGDGFVDAAAALETFADAIDEAKRRAGWAKDEHARGDRESSSARTAYDNDVSRARQEVSDAAAQGNHMTLTIIPFKDPGDAIRQGAIDEFNSAKADLEKAAHVAADGVRAGATNAPEKRKWYEKVGAAIGGFLAGAGEAVWDLLTMSSFSPINMLADAYQVGTGDMTTEELAAKYRMSVESAGDMLQALKDDPMEFGKQLGKGLLDWDTWADDPARALGHLVPDAVAAVFTAGTGTIATRGVKGGAEVLDSLGDVADVNRGLGALDDLGDLNKLDDIGDLSKLDNLDDLNAPGTPDLTPGELHDLQLYTGWGYDHINSFLRGTDTQLGNQLFPDSELARLSDGVSDGLSKLPAHEGQSVRGTDLPPSVLDQINKGGEFSDPAFMSSSTDLSVADRFKGGGNTLFHIDGHSGRDVDGLSVNQGESEILFDKGTKFDVVDKTWNPDGYWDIILKEKP